MKRLLALILALCMIAGVLAGCAKNDQPDTTNPAGNANTGTTPPSGNEPAGSGESTQEGTVENPIVDGTTGTGASSTGNEAENDRPLVGYYFMDPVTTNYWGAMRDVDFWNWSMVGGLGVYMLPNGGYDAGYFESWEHNEDATEWTIKIQDDARWSDGEDLTVDDFIFSKEYFMSQRDQFDPNMFLQWSITYDFEVEKIDDKTFKCILDFPFPDFIGQFAMPYIEIIPQHIWEGIDPSVFLTCDQAQAPIGAGPYVIKEYVPGQYMKFEANPYYCNGEPQIKELIMLIITDFTAAGLALENGDIDFNSMLEPMDYARLIQLDHLEGFVSHMNTHRAFKFNLDTVPYEVRVAANYFIDKELWLANIYGGVGDVLYGMFPRGVEGQSDEGLTYYEYNVEKGKQILEEAGYVMGADGFYAKDGETIDLEFLYTTGSDDASALMIQSMLQAGGIKVTMNGQTGTQRRELAREFKYDITAAGFALTSNPADYYQDYYDSDVDGDPTYLKDVWEAAAAEVDPAKKAELYHQIDVTINQDAIWIFGIQEHSAVAKKTGLDMSEAVVSQTYGFVHWEKLHWD